MMTGTVTQDWVDSVLQQHHQLQELVQELEIFLDEPRPDTGVKGSHSWSVALSQRLLSLHDELFRHFRFEEDEGVLQEIMENHPEAAAGLKDILEEHPEMLRQLRQIVSDVLSYSEGVTPEDPRIRKRISELLETFRQHEQEENHLFQRIEYRDTGAAD